MPTHYRGAVFHNPLIYAQRKRAQSGPGCKATMQVCKIILQVLETKAGDLGRKSGIFAKEDEGTPWHGTCVRSPECTSRNVNGGWF